MKLSLSAPDGRRAEVEPYAADRVAVRLADRFGVLRYYLAPAAEAETQARAHVAPKDPK